MSFKCLTFVMPGEMEMNAGVCKSRYNPAHQQTGMELAAYVIDVSGFFRSVRNPKPFQYHS